MFKAKDIMTRVVVCAWPQMPIYDAIRTLAERNITGLPVVDAQLKLVGVISEKDALRTLHIPDEGPEQTVADFMSEDVISFDANGSLVDLCDCLLEHPVRRVPITDNEKLVGIASVSDATRAILELKRQAASD
ncbi:MAG: CBS domain-containing protein [Planctomycetota bacterium]